MLSRKRVQLAFGAAVAFFLISAVAAGIAISRLNLSLRWIAHTYDVQVALADVNYTLTTAGRARASFDRDADEAPLRAFEDVAKAIPAKIDRLQALVADNADQKDSAQHLEDIELRRLAVLQSAIDRRKLGPRDEQSQLATTQQVVALGTEADTIVQRMLATEQRLLVARRSASSLLYGLTLWILAGAFLASLALFYIYYRLITAELTERERAEKTALESQAASRLLSMRLLHLQDEERRKFSRELHDSLGQYLAAAKMGLDALARARGSDELLDGARSCVEQAVAETRTISHLLHPPLLDETGLGLAARWYVEGFASRSGIAITSDIPEDFPRLARPVELAMFRVLQECLTNIHRHAKSDRADVSLRYIPKEVVLRVRDYGGGIAPEVLRQFRESGSHVGVGLAGMRERVREQGGDLAIHSAGSGVTVTVTMPVTTPVDASDSLPAAEDALPSSQGL